MFIGIGIGLNMTQAGGGVPAPSYDPDAEALFARFTTPPTTERKGIINTLITDLKAATIWYDLLALWLTAAETPQAARQNWKADQFNLVPVSGPTFTADRGYLGDGSSSYLSTGFTPSIHGGDVYVRYSASLWFWSRTNIANNGSDMGNITTSPSARMIIRSTGNNFSARMNDGASGNVATDITDSTGLFGLQRIEGTRQVARNGVIVGSTSVVSSGLPEQELWFLGANGNSFGVRQGAAGAIGGSLVGKEAAFYSAINTYMQAVGAA